MELKKLLNIALKKIKIMRKTIFLFSFLLITISINAQENNDSKTSNKTNLVPLTKELANRLCIKIVSKNAHQPIEKTIRNTLIESKLIHKNATKADIGAFINKNFNHLRCQNDPMSSYIKEQHIYERAFDGHVLTFFDDIILDEDYKVDINKIIKHNGKEFTLLDHINYIIKNESHKFDINRLRDLKDGIEEAIKYSLEEN